MYNVTCTGRCDGIGRRSGLKIHRWRQRTGSSPVTGTTWSQSSLCDHVFLCLQQKVVIRPLPCPSVPTATRFAGLAVGGPPCGRLFYKHQGALIFLLLLSKPDPLRWAPVWCRSMGGYFSFLTALYRINGICERQVPFVLGFVPCGPSTLPYFNGIAPASRKNGHILFIRIARGGWHGVK